MRVAWQGGGEEVRDRGWEGLAAVQAVHKKSLCGSAGVGGCVGKKCKVVAGGRATGTKCQSMSKQSLQVGGTTCLLGGRKWYGCRLGVGRGNAMVWGHTRWGSRKGAGMAWKEGRNGHCQHQPVKSGRKAAGSPCPVPVLLSSQKVPKCRARHVQPVPSCRKNYAYKARCVRGWWGGSLGSGGKGGRGRRGREGGRIGGRESIKVQAVHAKNSQPTGLLRRVGRGQSRRIYAMSNEHGVQPVHVHHGERERDQTMNTGLRASCPGKHPRNTGYT